MNTFYTTLAPALLTFAGQAAAWELAGPLFEIAGSAGTQKVLGLVSHGLLANIGFSQTNGEISRYRIVNVVNGSLVGPLHSYSGGTGYENGTETASTPSGALFCQFLSRLNGVITGKIGWGNTFDWETNSHVGPLPSDRCSVALDEIGVVNTFASTLQISGGNQIERTQMSLNNGTILDGPTRVTNNSTLHYHNTATSTAWTAFVAEKPGGGDFLELRRTDGTGTPKILHDLGSTISDPRITSLDRGGFATSFSSNNQACVYASPDGTAIGSHCFAGPGESPDIAPLDDRIAVTFNGQIASVGFDASLIDPPVSIPNVTGPIGISHISRVSNNTVALAWSESDNSIHVGTFRPTTPVTTGTTGTTGFPVGTTGSTGTTVTTGFPVGTTATTSRPPISTTTGSSTIGVIPNVVIDTTTGAPSQDWIWGVVAAAAALCCIGVAGALIVAYRRGKAEEDDGDPELSSSVGGNRVTVYGNVKHLEKDGTSSSASDPSGDPNYVEFDQFKD